MARPQGSNADEWALFLSEHEGATEFLAVQIAEALDEKERLRSKLSDARNRLDTIRETNPEISLDHDIARIDAVLANISPDGRSALGTTEADTGPTVTAGRDRQPTASLNEHGESDDR